MINLPEPLFQKNDKKAAWLISIFSLVVFAAVALLSKIKLDIKPGFNIHLFAQFNAIVNSAVTILLLSALYAVKKQHYLLHKKLMLTALVLSVLFLVSYICHHLFGETMFGDTNHDGILSNAEKLQAGSLRTVYLIILATHIPLAAIVLPFILFTAYRALTAEFPQHKKLARITWPVWLYVSVTGVLVYLLISPYYN
jgi:putative membrane protein